MSVKQDITAMDIFKNLPKTNCKECKTPTCFAFAALVIQGHKSLADCPYLDKGLIEKFSLGLKQKQAYDEELLVTPMHLKKDIAALDFNERALSLGARVIHGANEIDDMLAIPCLGRDFIIDKKGELHSMCHSNFWIHVPLLNYLLLSKGRELTGTWYKFDQLGESISYSNYFDIKCETVLRKLADEHSEVLFDSLDIFGGKPSEVDFNADWAVVIDPLPKLRMLFCYWKPEPDFDSKFSIYFDSSTDDNLDMESIYVISVGMVSMFKRIVARHSMT